VFLLLSVFWHLAPWFSVPLSWTALVKVGSTDRGFSTQLAHASVDVCFGQIQALSDVPPETLLALPANDFFDDDCIRDTRSALGAFVNHVFPNRVTEISALAKQQLQGNTSGGISQPTTAHQRYDIGTTIYLDRPRGEKVRMAFVATTTVTKDEGIRCDAENVFAAVRGVHRLMNTNRIDSVILPLLGSGHGSLRPQMSLLCMLTAIAECLSRQSGKHIKSVRIVVYQRDKDSRPAITPWQARRLLAFTKRYG
jgi:O-acetyl-ADP-ribose deacetylase (regulator of RNase III)